MDTAVLDIPFAHCGEFLTKVNAVLILIYSAKATAIQINSESALMYLTIGPQLGGMYEQVKK